MLPLDTTKDCIIVRSPRNCYEIGSIPCRRKWAGMAQVQSQLAALTIQLQELVKGKENVRKSGVSHVEHKVIIRMNVQLFNSI
jgi:hypothetical protein